MRKSGFTLIELLVYMAIMGFIVVVAGRVFSDSTVMRVRSQNMVKTAEEVGKVANLMSEDISQMGAKAWGTSASSGNADYIISQIPEVYISNDDSSSFKLYHRKNNSLFDSLVFRRADIDEDGVFLGVREISWAANENGELRRWCKTIDGSNGTPSAECPQSTALPVLIAKDVKKFSFYASAPGLPPEPNTEIDNIQLNTVFPSNNDSTFKLLPNTANANADFAEFHYINSATNTIAEFSRIFAKNNSEALSTSDKFNEVYLSAITRTDFKDCIKVPIKNGDTYVVEFAMPFLENTGGANETAVKDSNSTQFLPGQDHIAVGLRYNDGNTISGVSSDVLLYPPQSEQAAKEPRYAEFSLREEPNKDVCVALTFAFYSPLAYKGKLRFTDFKVYKKQTGAYHFVKADEEKRYEQTFAEIYATEDDANTARKLSHKKSVKAFELLLEIDKNGEVAGTYSKDTTGMPIPVPNNGVTHR